MSNLGKKARRSIAFSCLETVFDDQSFVSDGDFRDAFQHTITYKSRIHNVELDYNRCLSPWGNLFPSLIAGLRCMNVGERFILFSADGNPPPTDFGKYTIKTTNHLLGLRLGADAIYRLVAKGPDSRQNRENLRLLRSLIKKSS